ncbi:MAG: 3-phosphoshikimate 1-carboxyvinyltransferase, partial [bacterium]|nr:3-phosphoshikimate 1-carboxyvinyltransferase [bacterium]
MKEATVKKSKGLSGEITVPGDKSISHRAVLMGSIAEGTSEVRGFLRGEDTLNTLKACRRMGVAVEERGDDLTIHGAGLHGLQEPEDVLDLGNSGTGMRLLAGLLAGQKFFSVMTGDSYLRQRPMARITRPLREMGATILGREDARLAPLAIQGGRLSPMVYHSPVSSAQVKSALLLAGLYAQGTTTIIEPYPSRDHTEKMFRQFGCTVAQEGTTVSIVGGERLSAREIQVPGDFSSAGFFIVAALCVPGSEIVLRNVGINPTRTGLLKILKRMGADMEVSVKDDGDEPLADLQVAASRLRGTVVTGEEVPAAIDEFPVLCVAAALAEGESRITGAEELRVKETDRIRAMTVN